MKARTMHEESRRKFLAEARTVLHDAIDRDDVDLYYALNDLYYATKLYKSIASVEWDSVLTFVHQYDIGRWDEVDPEDYADYYTCIEFPDGRHLPVPILIDSVFGPEEDCGEDDADNAQNRILELGLRYCRPLRIAAIKAATQCIKDERALTLMGESA